MICAQSLAQCLSIIVGSLDERLSSDIVFHKLLWWVKDLVVGSARGRVDQSAGDSVDEELVVNLQLDGVFQRLVLSLQHFVEAFSLGDGSWEAIENKAAGVSISQLEATVAYPFWHSLLVANSFLIMLIMMSSLTRPP